MVGPLNPARTGALVRAFFGRVLRIFADFPGALVVAVHEDYLSMPEFQEAESFLETRIAIPAFENHAQQALGQILERRMAVQGVRVELSDVFHAGALEALALLSRSGLQPAQSDLGRTRRA